MDALRRNLMTLAGLGLLAMAGCHRIPASWYYAFNGYPDEPFETPHQRIERYRDLAAEAEEKTPQEQQQISQDLVESLSSEPDPLVRGQMVRTLARFPTPTAEAALTTALNDPHEHVRIACCDAWGDRGGPAAVQALGGVLRSEDDVDVRLAAARALGNIKDQAVVPVLATALEDSNVALQNRAMTSLENVTGRYYGRDVNAWRSFASGQDVPQAERSIAERFRKLF